VEYDYVSANEMEERIKGIYVCGYKKIWIILELFIA